MFTSNQFLPQHSGAVDLESAPCRRPQIWLATSMLAVGGLSLARAQTAEQFFDDSVIQDIRLTIDPADWETLRQHYLDDTYYHAAFTWNGITENIGIRSRGRGSRSPDKPNLDLNFAKYDKSQSFVGLSMVVMKANNQEASMMRERVAMQMFRRMGLPAPREAPARLFINGEYFGFYSAVEHVDEAFLERNFGESAGYLYEWKPNQTYHFEYLGEDPALYPPLLWDPKTHEKDPDPAPIVAMVRTINQASDADFVPAVSQYLDLKLFMSHVAIENFLSEIDGVLGDVYGVNNVYFYRFQGSQLSQLIPWDKDLAFMDPQRDIMQGVSDNVLARRAMAVPELRNTCLDTLVMAANLAGGQDGWLAGEIEREYNQIRSLARDDPHKQCIITDGVMVACGPGDFERESDNLRAFAAQRAASAINQVAYLGYQAQSARPRLSMAVNPASGANTLLARGSLAAVYGERLASSSVQADSRPLPRVLNGVFVSINGVRAPLLSLAAGQAVFQVPWDMLAGGGDIAAVVNGALSNSVNVSVGDFSPGLLAVAHASDYSLVTKDHPASPGEVIVIYATGLGPLSTAVGDGEAGPSNPPVATAETPAVSLNGVPAQVTFSGFAPDLVGLYQVNVQLPAQPASGSTSVLALTAGEQTATATIPVR